MKKIVDRFQLKINTSFKTPKSIFLFGLFFAFAVTLKEVLALSYNNFQIFSFGSIDFWNNINPYENWHHLSLREKPLDIFIYLPLFSILFTPFTLVPSWLGAFLWNFFTYSLFYFSIFNLPATYHFKDKKFIFFISCLLLFATMLSMQFNPVVAAIFLIAYTHLEKNNSFIAVLLISISGFIKVYGFFQLSILIFYPKFWKNIVYLLLISLFLLCLPLIHLDIAQVYDLYQSWSIAISNHSRMQDFYSIYRAFYTLTPSINHYASIVSIVILVLLFIVGLYNLKLFKKSFAKRAQYLGVLMSYCILFGLSSELHTYVIAITGYAIWYIFNSPTKLDNILVWINFFLLALFPIDIICPVVISKFVLGKLHLGVIVFFITWIIMVFKTFTKGDRHLKTKHL